MADDPLGLTPDPSNQDQKVPDYLGKESPLAFKGQPALPVTGAAAFGSPSAPITPGPGGQPLSGGEVIPNGMNWGSIAKLLFEGGDALSKLLASESTDLGTRGDVGGSTLSDYLRSLQGGGEGGDTLAEISGGELGLGAGEGGAEVGAGAADVAGEGIGFGAGSLASLAFYPFTKAITDWIMGIGPESGKMAETGNIREDFAKAFPVLQGAGDTFNRFQGLDKLPRDEQIRILQGISQVGGQELDQIPAVSQFTSTQGGRHSGSSGEMLASFSGKQGEVKPVDVSGVEAQTPILYMDSVLNSAYANDRLAQMGVDYPTDVTGTTYRNMASEDPMGFLDLLSQEGGVSFRRPVNTSDPSYDPNTVNQNPWIDMDPAVIAQLQTPGKAMETAQKIFSGMNPDFASTPLGKQMALLGIGGMTPPEQQNEMVQPAFGASFSDVADAAMEGGGEDWAEQQLAGQSSSPLTTPATGRV